MIHLVYCAALCLNAIVDYHTDLYLLELCEIKSQYVCHVDLTTNLCVQFQCNIQYHPALHSFRFIVFLKILVQLHWREELSFFKLNHGYKTPYSYTVQGWVSFETFKQFQYQTVI